MVWPAVIAAGAKLVGGILGERSADKRNSENIAFGERQLAAQEQFAKEGVRWRVEDAKAAGIHPLYALGAQTHQPSPVSVFQEGPSYGLAQGLADAGQDIGRSMEATRTATERQQLRLNQLTVERGELENELLRSQIARERGQIGPPFPEVPQGLRGNPGGRAPLGRVEVKPAQPVATDPGNPAKEAWQVPDYAFVRTPSGLAIVPSESAKDRIEDQFFPELMWAIRNNLMPNIDPKVFEPDPRIFPPGKGKKWEWSHLHQEFRAVPIDPHKVKVDIDFSGRR